MNRSPGSAAWRSWGVFPSAGRVALGLVLAALLPAVASAANGNWAGLGADANWSTTLNWSGASPPTTAETATFNGAGNGKTTVSLSSPVTLSSLVFDTASAAAYTIGSAGQTLTLNDSGGVTMNATVANNQQVAANVVLGTATAGSYTLTNNSTTSTLTFGGTIQGGSGGTGAAKTLTVTGSGNTTISGAIGNGGSTALALSKTGAGVLVLGSTNTFTGATSVDRGTNGLASGIIRATANNVFSSTATLNLLGGTIDLNGFNATVGSVYWGKDATTQSGNVNMITTGSGTLTLAGNVNMDSDNRAAANILAGNLNLGSATRTFQNNTDLAAGGTRQAATITISANVSGDAGVGITTTYSVGSIPTAFTLSGNNTYTGTTTIGGGYLRAGSATALGNGGNITFGSSGATLQYTSASAGTDWSARFKSSAQAVRLDTNSQTVTLGAIDNTNSGGLTKIGAGTLVLSGANTYTNTTSVNEGTLRLDKSLSASAAIVSSSALTLGGGTFEFRGAASGASAQTLGSLTINAGNSGIVVAPNGGSGTTLTLGNTWSRSAGGTLGIDLSAGSVGSPAVVSSTAGLVAGTQTATQAVLGYATVTDAGGTGFAANVGGQVVRYTGAAALAATSTGSTTNYRTAPGGTSTAGSPYLTFSPGLVAPAFNSLEVDTSAASGGNVLDLSPSVLTLTQGGLLTSGARGFTIQNGQLGASGSELIVHQAGAGELTITSLIGGGATALTKDGAGTLVLPTANFFTGATTINAGVVSMRHASALGTSAGGITVNNGAALELTGSITTPAKALTLVGSGVSDAGVLRSVSGVNTYTGTITPGILASTGSLATRINTDAGLLTMTGAFGASGNNAPTTAADLVFGGAGDTWVSGAINTLSGSVTKEGSGTLTFTGANAFTGGMNINGGVVTAQATQTLGSTNAGPFGRNGTISFGGGTLRYSASNTADYSWRISTAGNQPISIDTNSVNVTYATALTGTGTSLTKSGFGTLTLSAAPTYTGGTTVNRGTLLVSGALNMPTTGAVAVNAGGTFSTADGTARTTTVNGGLTLADGATLALDWVGSGRDTLTTTASATAAGTVGIQITPASTPSGSGNLVTAASGLSGARYFLANNTNYTATLAASDTAVSVSGYAAVSALTAAHWKGGLANAESAMALSTGAASNWAATAGGAVQALVPGSGADIFFSATGGPGSFANPVLGADMTVKTVTFNATTGLVTIGGANALTITPAASSAGITANETATINANVIIGAGQTWTTASGKTLTVNGNVGGSVVNTLTLAGAGSTVNFTGTSSYASDLTVSSGAVNFTSTAVKQWNGTSGNVNVNGGALNVSGAVDVNALSVAAGGGLNVNSGGTLVLRAAPSITGNLNVAGGVATIVTGGITLNNNSVLRVSSGRLVSPLGALQGSTVNAEITVTGGTFDRAGASTDINLINTGGAATEVINLAGSGAIFDNAGRSITVATANSGGSGGVAIVNLAAGRLTSGSILAGGAGNQRPSYSNVNFSGGTLQAGVASTTWLSADGLVTGTPINSNGPDMRKTYVNGAFGSFAGGAVIDTNGFAMAIPAALQAPAGSGVTATASVTAGTGYTSVPYVSLSDAGVTRTGSIANNSYQITGLTSTDGIVVGQAVTGTGVGTGAIVTGINGTTVTLSNFSSSTGSQSITFRGIGATAYATVNESGGVSGVVVTNPGVGYVGTVTPTFTGGGGSGAGATFTTGANTTSGLAKTGLGTLTLGNYNSYGTSTAGTTVSGGTLALSIGGASLGAQVAPLAVNVGGVLDLGGTSQTVGNFGGSGGVVLNSAVGTPAVLTVGNGNGTGGTFAGLIADNSTGVSTGGGTVALVKTGSGTIALSGANTFTGGTTVGGGTLRLDFATTASNVLSSTGGLTLAGGTLALRGGASTPAAVQTVAALTLARGGSAVAPALNGSTDLTLALGAISRSGGATLDVTDTALGSGGVTTSSGTPNAILTAGGVAYATAGGSDWAAKGSVSNAIVGLSTISGYTPSQAGSLAGNADVASGVDTTLTAGTTITSLRFAVAEQRSIALGGNTLTTGGILVGAAADASQITGGTLRGPAGADLVVIQNAAQPFTIGAAVANNGAATGLTKSGTGTLVLSGTNTFTGATSVNAGTLSLQGADALSNTAATVVAAGATLGLGANQAIGSLAGAGTVALGANVLTAGADGSSTVFSGTIGGTGGITKAGAGTLTLSGTNTYSGATTIAGGTLRAGSATALGTGSALSFANAAGALLDPNGSNLTIGSLTGGGSTGGGIALGGSTLTVGGDNTSPAAYSGAISSTGGWLVKTGSGTLTLGGNNTFNAALSVNAGTVRAASATALGGGAAAVALADAAGVTLDLDGFSNAIGSLTGGGATGGNVSLGSGTLTVGGNNATLAAYAGVISGAGGSLRKVGRGTLTLSGANTYGGTTAVAQGTLTISGSGTFGGNAANVSMEGGALNVNALTRTVNTVSIGSAAFDGTTTITGGTLVASSYSAANTYGNAPLIATVSTVLSGTGATLAKSGGGVLELSGANTYDGLTTITAGVVRASNAAALGATTAGTQVSSGAALQVNASLNAEPITISGTGFAGDGALRGLSGVNVTGPVTLGAAARINSDSGTLTLNNASAIGGTGDLTIGSIGAATTTISGAVGMTGGLVKDGAGTLNLSGANTFTGQTTLRGGTLTLDYGTQNNGKLADGAALSLGNGTLSFSGGSHTEVVASTTFTTGATTVNRTSGSSVLQLNALTRNVGAAVNFVVASSATSDTANDATGILGGWAVVNNADWAQTAASAADTAITAFTGYTTQNAAGSWGAGQQITNSGAISGTTPSGLSIASLRFNAANAGTVTIGDTLTIATGGILQTSTVAGNLQTITGGTLRGAAGADLVVHQGAATNTLTIASTIANNTSATALTKAGAGTLTLTNSGNTFSGGTVLNAGSLTAQAATQSTTASNNVLGSGPLVLNGGTLNLRDNGDGVAAAQTINYGINTTLNGAATVTVDRVATATTKTIQLGTLTVNNNPTLTVTNTNSYGLRFGTTTLAGNATFAPSAAAGLLLDTIDFGGAPRALTMSGAGELRVGMTAGATNTVANTSWTVSAGTLTAVAAGALGGANDTVFLSGGALQLLNDGSGAGAGTGQLQTIAHGDNVIFSGSAGNRTITTGNLGATGNAANKTFQLGSLVAPSGFTLTVTNNNGSGLEFTGPVTLGSVGGGSANSVTFKISGGGSNAPLVPGLTLSGVVQGGGFWMTGNAGMLKLTNPNNTFSSADPIVLGQGNDNPGGGFLSVTSAGALGARSNQFTIGANSNTSVLQFDGTFSVPHQINIGSSGSNARIDVTQGSPGALNVATLTTPLNGGAFFAQGFTKSGNGVLAIDADNNRAGAGDWWNGQLTVQAGAVRVRNPGSLGSTALVTSSATIGNTVVSATGAAVQFDTALVSGSLTVAEPFNIQGTGLDNAGALQAINGTTTLSGAITMANAATIGADAGATLVVGNQVSGAFGLTVAGAGSTVMADGLAANVTGLTKIGTGTLTIAVDNSGNTGAITVNLGTLRVGDATTGVGRTAGNLSLTPGSTLVVDNTAAGVANRLGGNTRTVSLSGGTLSFIGNSVNESLGALTPAAGASSVAVSGTGGTLGFASLGTRAAGGTLNFAGSGPAIQFVAATAVTDSLLMGTATSAAYFYGTDFATSTGAANATVTPFTGYTTGDLGTAASSLTTNYKLAGAQTAMNTKSMNTLSLADGLGVTINSGQTLTLDAAAIINNGGGSIVGGTLTTTSNRELILNYATAGTIGSVIGGSTGGLTKVGLGTLTLTGQNTYTGQTTVNQGTVTLGGGDHTLAVNQSLVLNTGATLNLGANRQYVGSLSSTGTVEGAGGTITGSGTLTTNTAAAAGTFAGALQGSVGLTKVGTNTLTLTASSSTTGTLNVGGGTLTLSDGGALASITALNVRGATLTLGNTGTKDVADRINDAAPITMDGGTLIYNGRAQFNSTETVGAVTAATGANIVNVVAGGTNVNSAQLTIGSLSRSLGAELFLNQNQATNFGIIGNGQRIVVTAGLTGNLTPVNGVVPGAFTSGNTDNYYVVGYAPGLGFGPVGAGVAGFPTATSSFATAAATDNVADPASAVVAANKTINSMKQATVTFTNGTATGGPDLLTIGSGMTIVQSNIWGTATQRGRITSGTSELFIMHRDGNATPDPIVHSVIDDNGGPVSLIVHTPRQDRGYYVHLTAPNNYSGGTFVHGGPGVGGISLDATSAGIVTIPAGGLVINNNGLVDMTGVAGQIAPSNVVTINGGGALNLMGTNTLAGIVFNSNGGTTQPTVTPYNTITAGSSNALATYGSKTGTLVITGNITSNPSNVAVTPLIDAGTLNLNSSTAHDITVAPLPEGTWANNVGTLSGLTISSVVQSGGFTKKGAGVLTLTGSNTFSSGLTIEEGLLSVGTLNATSATGPLGQGGSITMGGAEGKTGLLAYTGVTNVTPDRSFTMASGGAGGFLVGNAATTVTVNTLIGGAGGLTKSGPGTLVLGNDGNSYTGRTTVAQGTLSLVAASFSSNTIPSSTFIDVQRGTTLNVTGLSGTDDLILGDGQTIGGTGTVLGNMTIGFNSTISPGASPGILLQTGDQVWGFGGNYNWQMLDAIGAAGTGFDQLAVTGSLYINTGFNVNLWTLSATGPDQNGNALGFDGNQNGYWVIASATGGLIGGSNLETMTVNRNSINGTGGFTNVAPGTFTLQQGDGVRGTVNDVVLVYTVPEPAALGAALVGLAAAALFARRRRGG